MSELDKLKERLFGDPDKKLMNFNVFWGPEAHTLTPEERAKAINEVFDALDRGDCRKLEPWELDF